MTDEESGHDRVGLDVVSLLRAQVDEVHARLEHGFGEWLQGLAQSTPPPGSQPVAVFVHAATVEDIAVQTILRGVGTLFSTEWAGRGPAQYTTADLQPVRDYARAVFAATNAYLAGMTVEAANQPVDLSHLDMGHPSVSWVISRFVILELAELTGELVSAAQASKAAGF